MKTVERTGTLLTPYLGLSKSVNDPVFIYFSLKIDTTPIKSKHYLKKIAFWLGDVNVLFTSYSEI